MSPVPGPTHGCQIILVNDRAEVLLYLRDDKAWIPYPNTWCLPGGHLEDGETPQQCILREVDEEMGIRLDADDVHLLYSVDRSYGTEHTFWARLDVDVAEVDLTEGQELAWFTRDQVSRMHLGYEDDDVLSDFFARLLPSVSLEDGPGGGTPEPGDPAPGTFPRERRRPN